MLFDDIMACLGAPHYYNFPDRDPRNNPRYKFTPWDLFRFCWKYGYPTLLDPKCRFQLALSPPTYCVGGIPNFESIWIRITRGLGEDWITFPPLNNACLDPALYSLRPTLIPTITYAACAPHSYLLLFAFFTFASLSILSMFMQGILPMGRAYIHLELAVGLDDWYAFRQCPEYTEVDPPPGQRRDKRRDRTKNDVYAAFLLRPLFENFQCYLNGTTLIIFTGMVGLPLSTATGCLGVYTSPPRLMSRDAVKGMFYKPTLRLSHNRRLLPSPLTSSKSARLPQTLLPDLLPHEPLLPSDVAITHYEEYGSIQGPTDNNIGYHVNPPTTEELSGPPNYSHHAPRNREGHPLP